MSFKCTLVKKAIAWTPNKMIVWVANIILRDIAVLSDFYVDIDAKKSFVQVTLNGEAEPIEIALNGFAILKDDSTYQFILKEGTSNRAWMNTILARVSGKAWKIPLIPKYKAQFDLLAELLQPEPPAEPAPVDEAS